MDAYEVKNVKKEFRTYLRTVEGKSGTSLINLMSAAESFLPQLIKERFLPSFTFLYDEENDIKLLLQVSYMMDDDPSLFIADGGYISPQCLKYYIQFYCHKNNINLDSIKKEVKDEIEEQKKRDKKEDADYVEGAVKEAKAKRYERDPKARRACLAHYGCRCYVCGMDMSEEYGMELGAEAIEVHHIIPVSQRGGSYIVDPIRDLRPLCPNCHSIVHRKRDQPLDVEELKLIYNSLHQ